MVMILEIIPRTQTTKLFKVRPLFDLVRNNCIKIEPDKSHYMGRDETVQPEKNSYVEFQEYGEGWSIWELARFFLFMAENIVLEQNVCGGRISSSIGGRDPKESQKAIKFSSIIGSQTFHLWSNYNPCVFYQLQHCALIGRKWGTT